MKFVNLALLCVAFVDLTYLDTTVISLFNYRSLPHHEFCAYAIVCDA